ncbi:putative F-box domain-containing protein [Tanacetum coccineum]
MADYIPLEIQAEIMKRLPVISLIRFRTVSKQWKSLIDSPKFIADHCVIQHHTQSHRHLLLRYLEAEVSSTDCVARYFSIVDDDTFPHQKVFMTTPVSVNLLNYPAKLLASLRHVFDQNCRLIMSFDLTSEEFTEIYLPQNLASCKTDVCISKLNESLVVLEKNHASNANVWIMQNGDPKLFTHIFTINTPIKSIRDVAGFRKNGETIIEKKKGLKEKELIVYEPNSKQINYTGIAGPFGYFFVTPYTQTLLLLDHKDSVDSRTRTRTQSGRFRRVGDRTLKGCYKFPLAASSSTSYYGASKRYYSQEEVNELVKKKSKIIGKRISASFNKKFVNLRTQLAEKGIISLDKTPGIGEEDAEYEESDDEAASWNEV